VIAIVLLAGAALTAFLVLDSDDPGSADTTETAGVASQSSQPNTSSVTSPNLTLALRSVGASAFEPTVGIGTDGALYYQASSKVMKSTDRGRSWTEVFPQTPRGYTADPYLHVDRETGRVFSQQLFPPLGCTALSFSDDAGDTWTANPAACGVPHNDKQKIGTGSSTLPAPAYEGRALYLCSSQGPAATCQVSLDGGASFPISRPVFETTQPCSLFSSQPTPGPNGSVYVATATCQGTIEVGVTQDTGQHWTTHTVAEDIITTNFSPVPVAVDEAGTVYVAWVGEAGHLYYAFSDDPSKGFSTPRQVEPSPLSSTALPTATALDPGRMAIGYLATPDGNQSYPDEVPDDAGWTLHATVLSDADADTADPTTSTARAGSQDAVMHEGPCSFDGGRCGAVKDYIDVDHDAEGRIYVTGVLSDGAGVLGVQTGGQRLAAENGSMGGVG